VIQGWMVMSRLKPVNAPNRAQSHSTAGTE
jgi:hypothetical protein